MFIVWQAKLEGDEQERVTDETLDKMCDEQEALWEALKDNLLEPANQPTK